MTECEQKTQDKPKAERPVKKCAYRAKGFFIKFYGLQAIQLLMNLRQLFEIACAKVLSAGFFCYFAHGVFVQILRRVNPTCAENSRHDHFFCAETDGVYFYIFLLRENCRALWREFARIARAIG